MVRDNVSKRVIAALGAGLMFFVLFAQPGRGYAVEYGSIGGRPAYPDPANARSKSIFIHTITAGATINDAVQVLNYTDKERTLQVYATDSIVSSGGAFGCAQMVDAKKDVGSWIKMSQTEVTLKPQSEKTLPFTITAPAKPDVGENNGCIIIQEKNGPTETISKDGGNISISFRTGLRVALLVPGDIKKHLIILGYAASPSGKKGNYVLKPRVKNDGNVSLDADIAVFANDFLGKQRFSHSQQYPILRGATSDWNIDYPRPYWGGWMKSHFTATYDSNLANGVGDEANQNPVTLTSQEITFFVAPQSTALIIELLLLIVLMVVIYLVYRYFFKKRKYRKEWQMVVIDREADIVSLANSFNIPWKLLAKVNKLKAPYILRIGSTIMLPINSRKKESLRGRLFQTFHKKKYQREWEPVLIDSKTDIETLADMFGVSWRLLAKVNNLYPPYNIKAGHTVKLPPQPKPLSARASKPLSSFGLGQPAGHQPNGQNPRPANPSDRKIPVSDGPSRPPKPPRIIRG